MANPSNSQEMTKKRGPYRHYLVTGDHDSEIEPSKVPKSTFYRWKSASKMSEGEGSAHLGLQDEESSGDEHAEQEIADPNYIDSMTEAADLYDDDDDNVSTNSSESDLDTNSSDDETEHNRDEEQPLYDTSLLTLGSAMLLIMTFVLRHSLTRKATGELLTLISLLLPASVCQAFTVHKFDKFFMGLKTQVQKHFYCTFCKHYNGIAQHKVNCDHCGQTISEDDHFITIPIDEQLKNIIPDCVDEISKYKASFPSNEDVLADILDGDLYKEQFDGAFFKGTDQEARKREVHISLQMNMDGVSLFRSSTYSVWPVYFIINELPPTLRFTRKFRLFSALWFGKSKPEMSVLLRVVTTQLLDLFQTGAEFCVNGKNLLLRAILMCCVCDAPARCIAQNFTQFNGFYGCPTCLEKGKSSKTLQGTHTHTYPFNISDMSSGHGQMRTHQGTMSHALEAETTQKPVFGVKGVTWLLKCPMFDIIRGVSLDYMHCVCLGVTKKLISLWTNKKYKRQPWYIGSLTAEIDKRLLRMTPTNRISRLPRSLCDISNWKATEFRNFLLFYSIPTLHGILPAQYFNHLSCLVQALFILLQTSITGDKLKVAHRSIIQFCAMFSDLYNECFESSNMHALLHLSSKVKDLGPAWAHSCFFFEDLNKDLRVLFHGTQNIAHQIIQAVSVNQKIPEMVRHLRKGSKAHDFYEQMHSHHKVKSVTTRICDGILAIGVLKCCIVKRELMKLL